MATDALEEAKRIRNADKMRHALSRAKAAGVTSKQLEEYNEFLKQLDMETLLVVATHRAESGALKIAIGAARGGGVECEALEVAEKKLAELEGLAKWRLGSGEAREQAKTPRRKVAVDQSGHAALQVSAWSPGSRALSGIGEIVFVSRGLHGRAAAHARRPLFDAFGHAESGQRAGVLGGVAWRGGRSTRALPPILVLTAAAIERGAANVARLVVSGFAGLLRAAQLFAISRGQIAIIKGLFIIRLPMIKTGYRKATMEVVVVECPAVVKLTAEWADGANLRRLCLNAPPIQPSALLLKAAKCARAQRGASGALEARRYAELAARILFGAPRSTDGLLGPLTAALHRLGGGVPRVFRAIFGVVIGTFIGTEPRKRSPTTDTEPLRARPGEVQMERLVATGHVNVKNGHIDHPVRNEISTLSGQVANMSSQQSLLPQSQPGADNAEVKQVDAALANLPPGPEYASARAELTKAAQAARMKTVKSKPLGAQLDSCKGAIDAMADKLQLARATATQEQERLQAELAELQKNAAQQPSQPNSIEAMTSVLDDVLKEMSVGFVDPQHVAQAKGLMQQLVTGIHPAEKTKGPGKFRFNQLELRNGWAVERFKRYVWDFSPKPGTVDEHLRDLNAYPERQGRWQEHFAEVFRGAIVSKALLRAPVPQDIVRSTSLKLSPERTARARRKLKSHRGVGPDEIPAELLKAGGGAIPVKYFEEIFKRKGSDDECDNYRGVSLSDNAGKAFCPQLSECIEPRYNSRLPMSQHGAIKGGGTDVAHHLVRAVIEYASLHCLSILVLFIDFVKAFDGIIRELIFGFSVSSQESPVEYLAPLGVDQDVAEWLASCICSEGGVFEQWNVDPKVTSLVARLHEGSWFSHGSLDTVVRSHKGGRQGCVFGATVFNAGYSVPIKMPHEEMRRKGIALRVRSGEKAFWGTTEDEGEEAATEEEIIDATFVDDECIALAAASPQLLDRAIQTLLEVLCRLFRLCAMVINWAPGKTECMLRYRGKNASAHWGQHRHEDGVYVKSDHDGAIKLSIVSKYKHLGTVVSIAGTCKPDAEKRASAAMDAYAPVAIRVFRAPNISIATKMHAVKARILTKLMFHARVVTPDAHFARTLNQVYMRVLRRIVDKVRFGPGQGTDLQSLDSADRALCRKAYKEGHVTPLAAGAVKTAARGTTGSDKS
ncbi:unnamed protein product [Prorocentrum cordatum]|uniref:Reverse transcriptase domain-containing protein n=1 Tax=Prorocentrum cordatum TaxID=2364126 RepID=A0ABN9SYP5_9DINO|nr:unnamed protein product [Polarella glacialis]